MEKIVPQYEPNQEAFKHMLLCAACLAAGLLYFFFNITGNGTMDWYDWVVLALSGAGACFFYRKLQAYEKGGDPQL